MMRRDAQAVVLLIVGAALVKVSLSGAYLRYVRPGMGWVLVLTAIGLMLVGVVTLRRSYQGLRFVPVEDDEAEPDITIIEAVPEGAGLEPPVSPVAPSVAPSVTRPVEPSVARPVEPSVAPSLETEESRAPRRVWALLLAGLAVVLVVPPAPGAYQAARTAVLTSTPVAGELSGEPARLPVREYVARAVDRDGASLRGRAVTLSGFVVVVPDGRIYLARMVIGCCAADARPVEVGLVGNTPVGLAADQWIEVDGTYVDLRERDPVSQAVIPYLNVTAVRAIAAPANPYE